MLDTSNLTVSKSWGSQLNKKPPAESVLTEFERSLGTALPSQYKSFLAFINGGALERETLYIDEVEFTINFYYYLNNDKNGEYSVWANYEAYKNCVGQRFLPFAEDPVGNQFLIDLGAEDCVVCFWDHEEDEIFELTPSLQVFLDSLVKTNP